MRIQGGAAFSVRYQAGNPLAPAGQHMARAFPSSYCIDGEVRKRVLAMLEGRPAGYDGGVVDEDMERNWLELVKQAKREELPLPSVGGTDEEIREGMREVAGDQNAMLRRAVPQEAIYQQRIVNWLGEFLTDKGLNMEVLYPEPDDLVDTSFRAKLQGGAGLAFGELDVQADWGVELLKAVALELLDSANFDAEVEKPMYFSLTLIGSEKTAATPQGLQAFQGIIESISNGLSASPQMILCHQIQEAGAAAEAKFARFQGHPLYWLGWAECDPVGYTQADPAGAENRSSSLELQDTGLRLVAREPVQWLENELWLLGRRFTFNDATTLYHPPFAKEG